ncbi:MAG: NAD-dependent epimerase/dehydratase family protein [Litoreibacter sp.]|uniref:NAD-dependent epimerase/dehydratase family protein n=1 Tax=Litoreibacter sp. TaxID=1969459 RepID=UPI00329807F9
MFTISGQPILLMGASGRVGKLLQAHWANAQNVLTQSRNDDNDLTWSPIEDGARPLVEFNQRHQGMRAIVAMLGSTPSTSGDMSQTANLAASVVLAASQAGIPRVILASSSAVYPLDENLNENRAPAPTTPYGRAKLEMERVVAELNTDVEVCCLRIGNVAGADALLGTTSDTPKRLDQFADGFGPRRSYIGPKSLAECLWKLAHVDQPLPPILNCAALKPVEMADLLDAADVPWMWSPAPQERVKTQHITLDCMALARIVGEDVLAGHAQHMVAELLTSGALQ